MPRASKTIEKTRFNGSTEQCIRDILTAAIKDGLVTCDDDPQNFTAGDLWMPARVLKDWITPSP